MMKRNCRCLLVAFAFALVFPGILSADPPSLVGRLNLITGQVSFRPGSLDEWAPAIANYPLTIGDHVWADAGGQAEIHVGSTAIRLGSDTEMSFLNLDDQTSQIALTQGSLNVRLRSLDNGENFEIDTPNAVVALPEPGSYRVDVQENGDTSLTVWSGYADVIVVENGFRVSAGQSAHVSGVGSVGYYVQDAPRLDGWDAWCATRDRREDQLAAYRYVPREMIGVEDLDDSGTWIIVAGYGTVWTPSRVPVGWAPYRYGHWAWVAPWGWTWIDDAPWGFAPFHYGRWAYVGSRWVWVPGSMVVRPVYAPALVVFVGNAGDTASVDGVGWFPLAPQEVYVPPYTATTTYISRLNVTSVTNVTVQVIERINVTQVVYVNRNAPRAVTMVPRQVFVQSQSTSGATMALTPSFVQRAPILGMGTTVAPQRESVFGQTLMPSTVVRQPPAAVTGRNVFARSTPAPAPVPFIAGRNPQAAGGNLIPQQAAPAPSTGGNLIPQQAAPAPSTGNRTGGSTGITILNPSTRVPAQNPPTNRANPQSPPPSSSTGQGDARGLINTLQTRTLPDAEARLDAARKTNGVKLDFNGLSRQLAAARSTLNTASQDLAAGRTDQAMQKAQSVQGQLADIEKTISDAMNAARGNQQGQPDQSGQQGQQGRSGQPGRSGQQGQSGQPGQSNQQGQSGHSGQEDQPRMHR